MADTDIRPIDHTLFWSRTDTAAQCRAVIAERLGVFIVAIIFIAAFLYGISILASSILSEVTPLTIGLVITVVIVFTWPIAILATFAISALYVIVYAAATLRENKFPKNQWRAPGPLYYRQYIDRHLHAKSAASIDEWKSLTGDRKDLVIEPMFTVPIAKHTGTWLRVVRGSRAHNILRIESPHTLPSTVINSHIEKGDTLPARFQNGTRVHTNPELDKYFTVTTIHGAEKEVRQLLAVNVLWELLVNIDGCDVELRDKHIDFVWDEGTLSDAVIDGRMKNVESFLKAFLHSLRHDTAYENDYLQSASGSKGFLGSVESVMALSGVMTFVISLGVMYFAAGYYADPVDILAFGAMAIIVGGLVSVCLTLTIAMILTAVRSLGKAHYLLETARRIRHYALLYEERR